MNFFTRADYFTAVSVTNNGKNMKLVSYLCAKASALVFVIFKSKRLIKPRTAIGKALRRTHEGSG